MPAFTKHHLKRSKGKNMKDFWSDRDETLQILIGIVFDNQLVDREAREAALPPFSPLTPHPPTPKPLFFSCM